MNEDSLAIIFSTIAIGISLGAVLISWFNSR